MSRFFVNDPPAAVYEFDPAEAFTRNRQPNVVYIKPRMDVQTRARVQDAMLETTTGEPGTSAMSVSIKSGSNMLALLQHNITDWAGPDFEGVPCTPEMIARLDLSEPLIARVLDEITKRNLQQTASPNPKPHAGNTSSSNGSPQSTNRQASLAERAATKVKPAK